MKFLLAFLLGAFVGGASVWLYLDPQGQRTDQAKADLRQSVDQTRASVERGAQRLGDELQIKIEAWDLRPDEIRKELARSGKVVRIRARELGAEVSDAWITAKIESKLALDPDLSARRIEVRTEGGRVALRGEVSSEQLIGSAVALALDTDGVREVEASLHAAPTPAAR